MVYFSAGFRRRSDTVTRRHFPHAAHRMDYMDFEDDSRGWRFDMDMVIIYIYSVNWVIGFIVFCFLCYFFFPFQSVKITLKENNNCEHNNMNRKKKMKKAKCLFDVAFLSFRTVIDCIKHAVRLFDTSAVCDKVVKFGSRNNVNSRSFFIQWELCLDFGGNSILLLMYKIITPQNYSIIFILRRVLCTVTEYDPQSHFWG